MSKSHLLKGITTGQLTDCQAVMDVRQQIDNIMLMQSRGLIHLIQVFIVQDEYQCLLMMKQQFFVSASSIRQFTTYSFCVAILVTMGRKWKHRHTPSYADTSDMMGRKRTRRWCECSMMGIRHKSWADN